MNAVLRHNKTTNITATNNEQEFIIRHVLDCLAPSHVFDTAHNILDVGSGAGLPGIPLAIVFPEKTITLCESKRRKADILHAIKNELRLTNIIVQNKNAFELSAHYDTITARAYGNLEKIVRLAERVGKAAWTIHAYKGRRETIENELQKINNVVYNSTVTAVAVPHLNEERHIITITKRG